MSAPLFLELEKNGIRLSVSSSGELKVKGNPDTLKTFLPVIRENKPALIAELLEAEQLARQEQEPGGALSCWWRVTFPGSEVLEVFSPSGDTREGILKSYPQATDAQPFTPVIESPDAPMSAGEWAAIRAWLARIDEQAQETISHVLDVCQRNTRARAYALGRAGR